ncbi:hypothetical protein ABZ667_26415 [Streptomyces lavendulae]|uniref:hypothetical protein n=1 Tax=Streptomyces lavendulae TaxID=1914 RepID=UPI00340C9956
MFVSGCWSPGTANVDPDALPGVYRDGETGGEIRLHVGGRDMGDIQLYTASPRKVYLHPDVDGPVTLELVRVTGP